MFEVAREELALAWKPAPHFQIGRTAEALGLQLHAVDHHAIFHTRLRHLEQVNDLRIRASDGPGLVGRDATSFEIVASAVVNVFSVLVSARICPAGAEGG